MALLEKMEEQVPLLLLFLKTYPYWKAKTKPEQNEEAELIDAEMDLMERKARQKYQQLEISICKIKAELACMAA
jgi:hypothetical protein